MIVMRGWLLGLVIVGAAAADEPTPSVRPGFAEIPLQGSVRFEPAAAEKDVPDHFRLDPHDFEFKSRQIQKGRAVRVQRLTYPSPVKTETLENNTVHAEYFQPAGTGPFPACVVLHILGGDFLLAETVANHLAQQGVAALFVKMPYYGERRGKNSPRRMISREPAETVAGMTQAVLDIRRAAAWLGDRPEVDRDRLGITGISLGGIMSALAAAGEPRFQNVAVVLGGGNLADLLWANDTREAGEFRKKWMAEGGTQESFRDLVSKVDPATYGELLRGRRVLMIAARNDEVVIPQAAEALWESIGREPELVWIDSGHYTAVKYLPRELVRLDLFFNGRRESGSRK